MELAVKTKKELRAGRPRVIKRPSRLNLRIEKSAKQKAIKLAYGRGISIGSLLEHLVDDEIQREKNENP
jgi:hypothetical protein